MDIQTVRSFLMWCTIINGGLLLFSFLTCAYAKEWVYRMHGNWFPMPRETFDVAIYGFIGIMKVLFLLFNLVPYIALSIIG